LPTKAPAALRQAMGAAARVRETLGLGHVAPVCPYDITEHLQLHVMFVDIDMEGMYARGNPSRILLSSLRPLPRRAFTCAHETGHHELGHGNHLDMMLVGDGTPQSAMEERQAQVFAGFLLMPRLGIEDALQRRHWDIRTLTPRQALTIASEFGVGYEAFVTHASVTLGILPGGLAKQLHKTSPRHITSPLTGTGTATRTALIDRDSRCLTIDLEVGEQLMVDGPAEVSGDSIAAMPDAVGLYRGVTPGITRVSVPSTGQAFFARVCRAGYVGHAQFRHLEEVADD
jgi:Zn-dependent peptidase ImmA (M78 family)